MNDEPLEHRERRWTGWGFATVVLLPLLYLLSPPFVAMMMGRDTLESSKWLYDPLRRLGMHCRPFEDAYLWYLSLFPEWIRD
jgi:hypothetical protein